MSLSAVLFIAAIASWIYYVRSDHTPERPKTIRGFEIGESLAARGHHPDGHTAGEPPSLLTSESVFPYQWLTSSLTIIGMVSVLVGLFLYRKSLSTS